MIEPEAVYRFLRLSELRWLFEAGLRTMYEFLLRPELDADD